LQLPLSPPIDACGMRLQQCNTKSRMAVRAF
jgi:hypothetical protein